MNRNASSKPAFLFRDDQSWFVARGRAVEKRPWRWCCSRPTHTLGSRGTAGCREGLHGAGSPRDEEPACLKRELARATFKRCGSLLCQGVIERHTVIQRCRDEHLERVMCRCFRISVNGNYTWQDRDPSPHAQENARRARRIREIHEDLLGEGETVSLNRLARLMATHRTTTEDT